MDYNNAVSPVIGVILMMGLLLIMAGLVSVFIFGIFDVDEEPQADVEVSQSGSDLTVYVTGNEKVDSIRITSPSGEQIQCNPNCVIENPQRGDRITVEGAKKGINIVAEYQGEERLISEREVLGQNNEGVSIASRQNNPLAIKGEEYTINYAARNMENEEKDEPITLKIFNSNGDQVTEKQKTINLQALETKRKTFTWTPTQDGTYELTIASTNDKITIPLNVDTPPEFYLLTVNHEKTQQTNYPKLPDIALAMTKSNGVSDENSSIYSDFHIVNAGEETKEKNVKKAIIDENNRINADAHTGLKRTTITTNGETLSVAQITSKPLELAPDEEYNSSDEPDLWTTPTFEEANIEYGIYNMIITTQNDTDIYEFYVGDPPEFEIQSLDYENLHIKNNPSDVFQVTATIKNVGDIKSTEDINFYANNMNTPVQTKQLTLDGDQTKTITFTEDLAEGETHDLKIETPHDEKTFTATVYPPTNFQINDIRPDPGSVNQGNRITFEVDIKNTGAPGTKTIDFTFEKVGGGSGGGSGVGEIWFSLDDSNSMESALQGTADGSANFVNTLQQEYPGTKVGVQQRRPTNDWRSIGGVEQTLTSSTTQVENALQDIVDEGTSGGGEPMVTAIANLAREGRVSSSKTSIAVIIGNENMHSYHNDDPHGTGNDKGDCESYKDCPAIAPDVGNGDAPTMYPTVKDNFDKVICICSHGNYGAVKKFGDQWNGNIKLVRMPSSNVESRIEEILNDEVLSSILKELGKGSKSAQLDYNEVKTLEFTINSKDYETGDYDVIVKTPDDKESTTLTIE